MIFVITYQAHASALCHFVTSVAPRAIVRTMIFVIIVIALMLPPINKQSVIILKSPIGAKCQ